MMKLLPGNRRALTALLAAGSALGLAACEPEHIVRPVDIGTSTRAPFVDSYAQKVCNGSERRVTIGWNPVYFVSVELSRFTPHGAVPYDVISAPADYQKQGMSTMGPDCHGFMLETMLRKDVLHTGRSFIDYEILSSNDGKVVKLKHGTVEVDGVHGSEADDSTVSFDAGNGTKFTGVVHIYQGPEFRTRRMALDYPIGSASSGMLDATALPQERAGETLGDLTGAGGGFRSGDIRPDIGGFGKLVH